MNKKFLAVVLTALLILTFSISAFALLPPSVIEVNVLYGHPSAEAAELIVGIANIQRAVGSFNSLIPRAIIYTGNNVYLLANLNSNGRLITDNGDGTFTFGLGSVRSFQISLGTNGFYIINTSYVVTVHTSNIIALQPENGVDLVFNPDYVAGSDFQAYSDLSIEWVDYYSALVNYESDLAAAESRGESIGYESGLADGYETGYDDGRLAGYSDGYTSGMTEGRQEGYESGYADGLEDGYETGYDVGYQDGEDDNAEDYQNGYEDGKTAGVYEGYETGYAEGYSNGYFTAERYYEPKLEIRYDEGFEDGYETGYADGLSAGGGSGEIPVLYNIKYINASLESADVLFYLFWDGFNTDTLVFSTLEDMPAGYLFYTTDEFFYPSQVQVPSSISFEIPEIIRERFPQFEVGFISFVPHTLNNAECYLYSDDFDAGYFKGLSDGGNIIDGIGSVAAAPVSALRQALDFEIFGINISKVLVGILSVCLAWIAWRLFRKFIPV